MTEYQDKIILALDNFSVPMATELMEKYQDQVYAFKLNHVLYEEVPIAGSRIFCDYKLFDIPNTMCSVIEKLIYDGADMVTVHMLNNRTAIESLAKYADKIKLLGVTYLTSWDERDMLEICGVTPVVACRRALKLMEDNGFYGLICSPRDLDFYEDTHLRKITPGIRFQNSDQDDQVRTMTPKEALDAGADYLVMGRSFFALS